MNPEMLRRKIGETAGMIRSDPRQGNALRGLHEIMSKASAMAKGLIGMPPVCQEGCDACCYRIPMIHTKIEEAYVEKGVREQFSRTRHKKFSAMTAEETWNALRAEFGLPALHPEEESSSFDGAWDDLGVPCPMLEDGSCLIYERRPIECRLTLSPYPCRRPFSGVNHRPVMEPLLTLEGALHQAEELQESLRKRKPSEKPEGFLKGLVSLCKQIDKWVYGEEGKPIPLHLVLKKIL